MKKAFNFYIVYYKILTDKSIENYIELLENIKIYIFEFRDNKRILL